MPIARGDGRGIFWDTERVNYSDVPGRPGTEQHRLRMEAAVNARLVVVIKLDALPLDDPDRTVDPKRGDVLAWGREDGTRDASVTAATGYLVARGQIVQVLGWNGRDYEVVTRRADVPPAGPGEN